MLYMFSTYVHMHVHVHVRANKLETVLSRDRLACLAAPDMVFLMYM